MPIPLLLRRLKQLLYVAKFCSNGIKSVVAQFDTIAQVTAHLQT